MKTDQSYILKINDGPSSIKFALLEADGPLVTASRVGISAGLGENFTHANRCCGNQWEVARYARCHGAVQTCARSTLVKLSDGDRTGRVP